MSLEQLKKIRSQRVDIIYSELQQAKALYLQSEEELHQAQIQFKDYSIWRIAEEKIMFERLQDDYFSADEMKSYAVTLEKQKEKQEQLNNEIPPFVSKLEDAEKDLEKVRIKLQIATKDMEKVEEFIDLEDKENDEIEEKEEENMADELSCFRASQS